MTELLRRIRNAWLCLAHGHYTLARPTHEHKRTITCDIDGHNKRTELTYHQRF